MQKWSLSGSFPICEVRRVEQALSALMVWVTGDHKDHQEQRMGKQGSPWRADPGMCSASRGTLGLAMKAKGEVIKPIHPRDPWQVEFRLRRASMSWAPVPVAEIGQLGAAVAQQGSAVAQGARGETA